jgi:fumarate reductase flavoprotein subunit
MYDKRFPSRLVKLLYCVDELGSFLEVEASQTNGSEDVLVDVVVIGAGAAGLVAAMRAREAGATVLVLERDALPQGSTALSAGLIPAAGTRFQKSAQITDSGAVFAADIQRKAHGEADEGAIRTVVGVIGPALEWLNDTHGLPFSVIENFT